MNNLITVQNIDKIIPKFEKYGICIIKKYVTNEKLKLIDYEFNTIINGNHNFDPNTEPNICLRTNINSNIININKNTNIHSAFSNNFINTITENILGSFKSDALFIHKDFKNLKSNNTYPHFDYDRKLKFYLCLNDMNVDNGCFKALPNQMKLVEKKRKINRRNNIFTPGHKLYNGTEIKITDLIPIECDAGDLIIFDTNCIHAGGNSFKEGKYRKVIRLHLSKNY